MNPNMFLKYRTDSMRASWWDYNSPASYFITICVRNKACDFGEISDKVMQPSDSGRIAEEIWHQIPNQFEKVSLGAFVLMPNHIHGIIHLLDNSPSQGKPIDIQGVETPIYRVSTPGSTPATIDPDTDRGGFSRARNPMFHENLGRIMRWFKGRSTFEIRKEMDDFHWQRNYHDHIILNDSSLGLIENYIITNPLRWKTE